MPGISPLVDIRAKVGALLESALTDAPGSPNVLTEFSDSIQPPCVRVGWAEPWLENFGQTNAYNARLELACIGGRIEPDPGVGVVEDLVSRVLRALNGADYPYAPTVPVSAPRLYTYAGVGYLAAMIVVRAPVGVD